MIDQVCSMALTIAHHDGRDRFAWADLVEAMTSIESGTAIGVEYIASETRAVAIHEAGYAAAAHIYRSGVESTRLSIRRRGGSLGHHQAQEKEERFSKWRSEEMGAARPHARCDGGRAGVLRRELHGCCRRRAERDRAGRAHGGDEGDGARADRAERPVQVVDEKRDEEGRFRIAKRFEAIGIEILNRTSAATRSTYDPIQGVLADPDKRAMAAQLLGQAYVIGPQPIDRQPRGRESRRRQRDRAARDLRRRPGRAAGGSVGLQKPELDLAQEDTWPRM